jgi:hypothetical protein
LTTLRFSSLPANGIRAIAHLVSTDTIFALSSGRLPAAIAVVRVSGPQAARR